MSKRRPVEQARFYLEKWLPHFGMGHYRLNLSCLPASERGKVWGRSLYVHEEEFLAVQSVPDGVLPDAQMEALMLHELAHGLIELARTSEHGEEVACNRIVRLALGRKPVYLPNEHHLMRGSGDWLGMDVSKDSLRAAIDDLPEEEREAVNRFYWERQGMAQAAREMNLSDGTAFRRLLRRAERRLGLSVGGDA